MPHACASYCRYASALWANSDSEAILFHIRATKSSIHRYAVRLTRAHAETRIVEGAAREAKECA